MRCRCEIVDSAMKRQRRRGQKSRKCNVWPSSFRCASHRITKSGIDFWFQLATGLLHLPIIKLNGDSICFYSVDHWMASATMFASTFGRHENVLRWRILNSVPFTERINCIYMIQLVCTHSFRSHITFGAHSKNCHDFVCSVSVHSARLNPFHPVPKPPSENRWNFTQDRSSECVCHL